MLCLFPKVVFEAALSGVMGAEAVVRTLEDLLRIVPAHAIVRRHFAGDFCVALPIAKCSTDIGQGPLSDLPVEPFSPNFCASKNELFVPLRPSSFSDRFWEVISPFPGEDTAIDPLSYPEMTLKCGDTPLFFPPCSKDLLDGAAAEGETTSEGGKVELIKVMKGDVGAGASPGALRAGDQLFVRDHFFTVKSVTTGGEPYELYHGADLIVFQRPFHFNAKKAVAHISPPVKLRAKHGFLPRSAMEDYEPVHVKFVGCCGSAAKLGMGTFTMEFSNIACNRDLTCHRDLHLPPML